MCKAEVSLPFRPQPSRFCSVPVRLAVLDNSPRGSVHRPPFSDQLASPRAVSSTAMPAVLLFRLLAVLFVRILFFLVRLQMRLLSSSLCGQLIVREVPGNTEVEASQPRSCLTPCSSSGSRPSPPVPSVNARAVWDQPGSCPALQRRSSQRGLPPRRGQDAGPHSPPASGRQRRCPSAETRAAGRRQGSLLPPFTQASLADRAEGRGSDTVCNWKAWTSTQPQSPTHPTDPR